MKTIRILDVDWEDLQKNDSSSVNKLVACDLRAECFSLFFNKYRNDWEEKRLQELLKTPACSEDQDFIEFLEYIK